MLRVHHVLSEVRDTLGPGLRAAVWVKGCTLQCRGCMVPETWASRGGRLVVPEDLARQLLDKAGIDGVTVSGGEPTEQASAVARLLRSMKQAGKNTWLYSGYTLEELVAKNDHDIDELLSYVDVLVDGRYDVTRAGAFRLRGSSNQRIIHLTDAIPPLLDTEGEASRVEIRLNERGEMIMVGIPPPGFLKQLQEALEERGLVVSASPL